MNVYKKVLENSNLNYAEIIKKDNFFEIISVNNYFKKIFKIYSNNFCEVININLSSEEIENIVENDKYQIRKIVGEFKYDLEFFKESENKFLVLVNKEKIYQKNFIKEINSLDFIATLSHELRTPINLIISCLQVMDLNFSRFKCEKEECSNKKSLNRYLSIINQNSLRLLRLVNNLIDSNKIEAGKFEYNPKNYDIVNVVEGMCLSVSDFVEKNNLKITFDTNYEEKIVAFDIDSMERIILNLLSNAIKFNKENGIIEVILDCENEIVIKVKDSGIGIPKEKLKTIFERFEQLKNDEKLEKQGSGIGLSLVKSLVESQGGKIEVKSKVNVGTEFKIILPNYILNEDKLYMREFFDTNSKIDNMKLELSDIY